MIEREFSHGVALRRIPYPYQAMLAICSDLDETPDKETYLETMRYLNTNEETKIGRGVGLEVGNTIYFDMPFDQFSYWNTDDEGRRQVRTLIKSGHIDCLHSYGDLATTRKHVERNLAELARYNCMLEVWIDHGIAPSNFDGDIMCGSGDVLGSPIYHADLTCDHGIKYVWRGRVTSIIGQNRPRSLRGIWDNAHHASSAKTLAKEAIKGILSIVGNRKYKMHGANVVLRKTNLRDEREVFEFIRSNPHWGGVSSCETAIGIPEVLTTRILDRLVSRRGVCVLYTHLGKIKHSPNIFPVATRKAFELLRQYSQEKKILVTTTRRILDYCRAFLEAQTTITKITGQTILVAISTCNEAALSGITIYIDDPLNALVTVNGKAKRFTINEPDSEGKKSISLPWIPLDFPTI